MAGTVNEVDEVIRNWIADNPKVVGYVVITADGIPIKYHEKMPHEKAVQYAALLSSFCMRSRQCLRELLPSDNELTSVRLRTKEGTEIIAVQFAGYTLIAIQNCTGKPYDYGEESVDQKEQEWEEL
ncbi:putative dynein light chain 2B, cytoplasmic [Toxoplasma gondii TgCatPRC2]|uniref:Dynein light chain 2B, cytoplasmic, putative n=15 Tax=Toxoplasma gondii TaxID=5811 RepID=A0A125YJI3_TOXGM|nr:dynein light chain 2B, cytoplasmic, putative [Toxoplasma gondii ME49]EPR60466.1 putative dynein light chain 2B, cytoplasmic [Toxoplasma gondii GT1]ESS31370.1 putative dynein light chain 2B, cytoplasmic [Toxoplasma gondii VEG]KAF4643477.1 putative dynein light chain 2B, cytoplasmic [Toxoplasma gondii]KFG39068.1 putative dynein light chain 2B, cytoplasmic [Toxoplasma gondii p89]KFG39650.1 putative dynein light chain 2B, cytoplasmic [Toxoplasma gondii GAB2-2007-GAL-DOM2]KFG48284.1 putative dy|eukprot:XP_002366594.1 dynein light chain 2B, cytoplasmic, putative [Toxoplasma gondii ME49]